MTPTTTTWGEKMPGFLEDAKGDVERAEDELAAARRRVTAVEGQMAGYEHMTTAIARWTTDELVASRDALGKRTDGGHDLMGRYLAVLDELSKRGVA